MYGSPVQGGPVQGDHGNDQGDHGSVPGGHEEVAPVQHPKESGQALAATGSGGSIGIMVGSAVALALGGVLVILMRRSGRAAARRRH
ncbi:hypothetical protein [Streptomyces sp. CB03911]|uniref:hypothetical protein n=1 Tax=Streptomyces sp. CB03911 TaxID=1804758 RepID=UPI00256FEE06|nr:hypothetical protein [Streptomyces sp. CB03911]